MSIKFEYRDIDSLIPYENNPRKHTSIKRLEKSVEEYGFINPIIIDEDDVILSGHGRLIAARKEGLEQVPCIRVDHLDEEGKIGFRIADNSSAEESEWDQKKLKLELEKIDFKLDEFKLDFEEPEEDEGYYGDERERTYDAYNLSEFDYTECEGFYDMPTLEPCDVIPDDIISFNYMLTATNKNVGVHFYVDDYQFERIWNRPDMYIDKLKEFQCAFTPDFSLYLDMPMAMKVWNTYRSRLIGQIMQRRGLNVIPTVSWAEPATFQFCFDGLPVNSTLSVSTIGVKLDPEATQIWRDGMDAMISQLRPKRLLVYGGTVEYDYGDIEVKYYENATTERMSGK